MIYAAPNSFYKTGLLITLVLEDFIALNKFIKFGYLYNYIESAIKSISWYANSFSVVLSE